MKTITYIITIVFTVLMASSALAGDIIGNYSLSNDRGLVKVKSVDGNKMSVDIVYATRKGKLIILTGVFADYNSQTRQAVYSEDKYCPDALKLKFQNNGKVVLREAVCAEF